MNIKQKVRKKHNKMSIDVFLNQTLLQFNKLFFFKLNSNQYDNATRYIARSYYLPKDFIRNYNVIVNGNNLYDQLTGSDKKQYKEIRKLAAGQSEDYTTGCNLDYDYIKKLLQTNIS